MRLILISLLILLLIDKSCTISPYCQITKELGTIPVTVNETRLVDLLPLYYGYNIDITTNVADDVAQIIDPITTIAQNDIATLIPNQARWSILSPQSDWNGVWQKKAAILYQTSSNSVFVNLGNGVETGNYQFKSDPIQVAFQNQTTCYDAQYIDSEHVIISCEEDASPASIMVVLSHSAPSIYRNQEQFKCNKRKLIKYRNSLKQIRLLSLNIQDQAPQYNSYVQVFVLSDTYEISKQNTLKSSQIRLGQDPTQHKFTDIVSDDRGYIYLAERDNGIYKFSYQNKTISQQQILVLKDQNLNAISMTRLNDGYYLSVQLKAMIIRFYDFTAMIKQIISLPSQIVPVSLRANQNYLVVEGTDSYYFYTTNKYDRNQIVKVIPKANLLLEVQSSSDRALTVQPSISILHSLNDGYLWIKKLTQSLNITLTFTSKNETDEKTCDVTIDLQLVTDFRQIIQLKEVSDQMTAQYPVQLYIKLDDYFAGSQLKFNVVTDVGVKYTRNHIEPINVPQPKNGNNIIKNPDLYTTLAIDSANYYRLTVQNATIYIEKCTLYNRQISVASVNTLNAASRITRIKMGNAVLDNIYQPIIAYQTEEAPNSLIIVDITKRYLITFTSGNLYTPIDDFVLSTDYFVITNKALYSMFLVPYQNGSAICIDKDYFASRNIQGIQLFKPHAIKTIENSNLLYVININQIIVFDVSKGQVSFVTLLNLEEDIDANTEWDIVVTQTNLLVIFAEPINKVYNYKIIGPYNYVLLGTLELFQQTIPRPIKLQSTNQFVFLQTGHNGVTVLRIDQPSLNANHHYSSLDKPSWFVATKLYDSRTIFQLRQINGDSNDNNLFFPTPSIWIETDAHQKQFKKPYNIVINVVGLAGPLNLPITLEVFNYQTTIEVKESAHQKLWLPSSSNSDIIYLDINNFIGSVANYEFSCPYCNNQKIKLIQPFDLTSNIQNMEFNDYINLDKGVIWLLTNDTIYFSKDDGATAEPIKLSTASSCLKFSKIDKDHILLFCQGLNSQQFISVTADSQRRPIQTNSFLIDPNFTITNIHSTIYIQNLLFILDNNNAGTGTGIIRVFGIATNADGSINGTVQIQTLDYTTFSLDKTSPIQGFDILPTDSDKTKTIICTIDEGVGYGNFNLDGDFSITGSYMNLNTNSSVSDYTLDGNRFLQIKYLYSNLDNNQHTVLMTITLGAHLQLTFKFDKKYSISDVIIVNSFNKYGSQRVANTLWMTKYSALDQNLFIVTYINSTMGKITYAQYKIPQVSIESTVSIKGAVGALGTKPQPGYLYRNSTGSGRFLITTPKSQGSSDGSTYSAYDASQTLKLKLNYQSPGDFDVIYIKASNDFSSATNQIDIDFNVKTGLKWYVYILIALGALTLIGVAFGVWTYAKRRRSDEKKISLVTEDQEV